MLTILTYFIPLENCSDVENHQYYDCKTYEEKKDFRVFFSRVMHSTAYVIIPHVVLLAAFETTQNYLSGNLACFYEKQSLISWTDMHNTCKWAFIIICTRATN